MRSTPRRPGRTLALLAGTWWLSAFVAASAHGAVVYDTVALTGDAAPGVGSGIRFGVAFNVGFLAPSINDAGEVAFRASLVGPGVDFTNDRALFAGTAGALRLVAREADAAPGTDPAGRFRQFDSPVLNDHGQVAFFGLLDGPGVTLNNDRVVMSEAGGSLGRVAQTGQPAPGLPSPFRMSFFDERPVVFNDAGQTALISYVSDIEQNVTLNNGLFTGTGGALRAVATRGMAAPGTEPGVSFAVFERPALNQAGQLAFKTMFEGPGITRDNRLAWYLDTAGALRVIARTGDAVPGEPDRRFDLLLGATPALNNAGQNAFVASTRDHLAPPDTEDVLEGVYLEDHGTFRRIAQIGEPAPFTEPGLDFDGFRSNLRLNDAGELAFLASFSDGSPHGSGTFGTGLYTTDGDGLRLVARSSDAAPGTDAGVTLGFFWTHWFNDAGQSAFLADLAGPGVDSSNRRALFATDPAGMLHLIAREGTAFDLDGDPLVATPRTVATIDMGLNLDGGDTLPRRFNDAGQLAFTLNFTDGSSGVFLATVPEPVTTGVAAMAWPLVCGRRSRDRRS